MIPLENKIIYWKTCYELIYFASVDQNKHHQIIILTSNFSGF